MSDDVHRNAGISETDLFKLSDHTPIIEEKPSGRRHLGGAHEIMFQCCLRDERNSPKYDANGKLIKQTKKGPAKPGLYPKDQ